MNDKFEPKIILAVFIIVNYSKCHYRLVVRIFFVFFSSIRLIKKIHAKLITAISYFYFLVYFSIFSVELTSNIQRFNDWTTKSCHNILLSYKNKLKGFWNGCNCFVFIYKFFNTFENQKRCKVASLKRLTTSYLI